MSNKTYSIETISDILNATNEHNIDNFLTDLKGMLLMTFIARDTDPSITTIKNFNWTDDGKNNIDIIIKSAD